MRMNDSVCVPGCPRRRDRPRGCSVLGSPAPPRGTAPTPVGGMCTGADRWNRAGFLARLRGVEPLSARAPARVPATGIAPRPAAPPTWGRSTSAPGRSAFCSGGRSLSARGRSLFARTSVAPRPGDGRFPLGDGSLSVRGWSVLGTRAGRFPPRGWSLSAWRRVALRPGVVGSRHAGRSLPAPGTVAFRSETGRSPSGAIGSCGRCRSFLRPAKVPRRHGHRPRRTAGFCVWSRVLPPVPGLLLGGGAGLRPEAGSTSCSVTGAALRARTGAAFASPGPGPAPLGGPVSPSLAQLARSGLVFARS